MTDQHSFLRPSTGMRVSIVENPTPLRRRFGCSRRSVDDAHPFKAGVRWGTACSKYDLRDLLAVTPAIAYRLLGHCPTLVLDEAPVSIAVAMQAVLARVTVSSRLPRFIVLPTGTPIGNYSSEAHELNRQAIVLIRLNEVEKFSALVSPSRDI